MQTLSYGYKLPQTPDKGTDFFPALEDNIQQLNDHAHDGNDSALLSATSSQAVTQALVAADWVLVANGIYKQTVNTPTDIGIDTHAVSFKITDGAKAGHFLLLSVERVSATSYDVFINDNTQNVTAIYT